MSKYDDLLDAVLVSNREFRAYQERCWKFAHFFVQGYRDYLNAPEWAIEVIPLHETADPSAVYSVMRAMNLDEDGYWRFGLAITLRPSEKVIQKLQFQVRLKELATGFCICVSEDHEWFSVAQNNTDDFLKIYDFIQDCIVSYFRGGLKRFIDQDKPMKKIGFL